MQNTRRKPIVIIVGSGRSGTSTVARLCHEKLNICMGHYLKGADAMNPQGYYEDLVSHGFVRTMKDGIYGTEIYLDMMNDFHRDCANWGAKDPWFLYLPIKQLKLMTPKLCIVCTRDLESTVKSWEKIYQADTGQIPNNKVREYYYKLTSERTKAAHELINDVWTNHLTLDFTNKISEEEIISRIKEKL